MEQSISDKEEQFEQLKKALKKFAKFGGDDDDDDVSADDDSELQNVEEEEEIADTDDDAPLVPATSTIMKKPMRARAKRAMKKAKAKSKRTPQKAKSEGAHRQAQAHPGEEASAVCASSFH